MTMPASASTTWIDVPGGRLAAGVPAARLIRIPDVAHIVGTEVPRELAALIVEHLAPLPRWG